jgi:hypothetical protein
METIEATIREVQSWETSGINEKPRNLGFSSLG